MIPKSVTLRWNKTIISLHIHCCLLNYWVYTRWARRLEEIQKWKICREIPLKFLLKFHSDILVPAESVLHCFSSPMLVLLFRKFKSLLVKDILRAYWMFTVLFHFVQLIKSCAVCTVHAHISFCTRTNVKSCLPRAEEGPLWAVLLYSCLLLSASSPSPQSLVGQPITHSPLHPPTNNTLLNIKLLQPCNCHWPWGETYLMYALSTYGAIYSNYKNYFWTFLPFTFYKVTVLNHRFRSNLHLLRGLNPEKSSSVGRKKLLELSCTFSVGQ
jgi:hypothetical protein